MMTSQIFKFVPKYLEEVTLFSSNTKNNSFYLVFKYFSVGNDLQPEFANKRFAMQIKWLVSIYEIHHWADMGSN